MASNEDKSIEVKVIAGKCFDIESKVFTVTPTLFWDVRMLKSTTFQESIPEGYNAFIYVLEGTIHTGKDQHEGSHGSCIVFKQEGDAIQITSDGPARFAVLAGKPIGEPIVQHGPFVMNTREEIFQAFQDYQANKF